MSITADDYEAAILGRLVVSPKVAEAILSIRFPHEDRERMRRLADKGNKGILSGNEQAEIEGYRRVGTFLELMQSKARLALRRGAFVSPRQG